MATTINGGSQQHQQQQQEARTQQQIPDSVVLPPSQDSPQQQESSLPPSRKSTSSNKTTALQAAASDRLIARDVWVRAKNDEVRDALGRMLGWVEELTRQLNKAYQAQNDLETNLTLTKSNLQLALANTEMLEEALKRNPGVSSDVGWRRNANSVYIANSAPRDQSPSRPPSTAYPKTGESGFFKFRWNSSTPTTSSSAKAPSSPTTSPPPATGHSHHPSMSASVRNSAFLAGSGGALYEGAGHVASASVPSLVNEEVVKGARREEELTKALATERAAKQKVLKEKAQLEEELESLSQALFEEANKMVSTERRRVATLGEELSNISEEKAALRGALRIVESENATLRDTCREMRVVFQREGRAELISLPESPPATSVVRTLMGEDVRSFQSKATAAAPTSTHERKGSASSTKAVRATSPVLSTISRKGSAASIASTSSQSRTQRQYRSLTIDVDLSQSATHLDVGGTVIDLSTTPHASSTAHPRPSPLAPLAPAPVTGSRLTTIPPPASMADMNLPTPVGTVHQIPNPLPHGRPRSGSQTSVQSTASQRSQAGRQSRLDHDINSAPFMSGVNRGGFSLGV